MAIIRVSTQAELDAALKAAKAWDEIRIEGSGYFELNANPIEPTATVHAWGSATVRAGDSATVHAGGSATVHAGDSATVHAGSPYVGITKHAKSVRVEGKGRVIEPPALTTIDAWCEYHGLEIVDGIVTLFKAVRADFRSKHGMSYAPGTVPVAPDWDGGKGECGGGLHFSPRPTAALTFDPEATKFLACPVAVVDIRAPQEYDSYPHKLKARGCAGPVQECDIDGVVLPTPAATVA